MTKQEQSILNNTEVDLGMDLKMTSLEEWYEKDDILDIQMIFSFDIWLMF